VPSESIDTTTLSAPAFFGKIPGHGDFISRGFTKTELKNIDDWLSEWMKSCKAEWQVVFEDNYRDSQPWLFSGECLTAILMPSLDRVGRLFPIFAVASAKVRVKALYDVTYSLISEPGTGDQFYDALTSIKDDGSEGSDTKVKGWFLPDEKELALLHPFEGENTDWVRGALR